MKQILIAAIVAGGISLPVLAQSEGDTTTYYPGDDRKGYIGNATDVYPKTPIPNDAPADVVTDIEALITDFAGRWTKESWLTIPELWDRGEEAPYLLLVHQPDWLVGWDEIDGYFNAKQTLPVKEIPEEAPPGLQQIEGSHYEFRTEKELAAMMYTADRIHVRQIADDLAAAVWYVDFQYKPMFTPAKAEHFKANAMFRKTDDGWKFIHYGEAAMSTIMYMERLYRGQVSQEFLDSLKQN